MNILMTGASGFIGQRILAMRNELFDKDDNLFLITSKQIGDFPCLIHKDYTFTEDDLVSSGIGHIDVVLLIGHYVSERHNNHEVVAGNIKSINNVVHLMNLLPNIPQNIVYCSSMSVYGSRAVVVDENTSPCPETPYALSKLMIESYLREWCMSKNEGVKLHILRLSHIYGPRDNRQYSIPIWLQAKFKSQKIEFTAKPEAKRNLIYIDDCCRFIARACYLKEEIPLINVVSSQTITLFEIAQMIAIITENEVIHYEDRLVKDNHAASDFRISCLLCEKYLGKQMVSLEEGLSREFEYYKNLMG